VQIDTKSSHIIIICECRSPAGNFRQFLNTVETTLKHLYKPKIEFLMCGDVNVNYLLGSCRKAQLSSLLNTFNVSYTVSFPTRTHNSKGSIIDNIFIDNTRLHCFAVSPIVNGLSDHDIQYIILKNVFFLDKGRGFLGKIRLICNDSISNFREWLKKETWANAYEYDDVNDVFNSFLNTFFSNFQTLFPCAILNVKV
jgi:hypothetical protein